MNLHKHKKLFSDTIRATADHLKINEEFVEKDYWITLLLNRLSCSKYSKESVFKGGTSLLKGFGLINRFSEDVDIAIISTNCKSSNELKNLIRTVEKEITAELNEIELDGMTSKGSRFRKTVHLYESINPKNKNNKVIVEINSFANTLPHQMRIIRSLVYDFLEETENTDIIEIYDLEPFQVNVLDKGQTLMEKLVSLIRFSFDEHPVESIKAKIRHFYDLHFLMLDNECISFVKSEKFKNEFYRLLEHDKGIFDEPDGWQYKTIKDSPLVNDFENIWNQIKTIYLAELSALSYSNIPTENEVSKSYRELIKLIQ